MKDKKFKIYDKTTKKLMREPKISLSISSKGVVTILQDNTNTIICEFTGLYDKNGKEIFEKDIVATYGRDISGKYILIKDEVLHIIKARKGISEFKIKKIRKGISNLKIPFLEDAIIIGNSIENPELLD